jgi:hypothetical protein
MTMKLTDEQRKKLSLHGDREILHSDYDKILEWRLEQLDPEFLSEMRELVKDIGFWYA